MGIRTMDGLAGAAILLGAAGALAVGCQNLDLGAALPVNDSLGQNPGLDEPGPTDPGNNVVPAPGADESGVVITSGEQPLVVIDGEAQPAGTSIQALGELDIDKVEIVKGDAARTEWGERGRNGVIKITTRDGGGGDGS